MQNEELLLKAQLAEGAGLWQDAEARYLELLDKEPQHSPAWCALGLLAARRGAPDLAAAAFTEAVNLEPNNLDFLAHQADACRQAGHPHRALAAELRIADLCPLDPDPQLALARSFADQGLLSEAVHSMQLAASHLSDAPEFMHRFAQLQLLAGNPNAAKALLQDLLLLDLAPQTRSNVALDLGIAWSLSDGTANAELENLRASLQEQYPQLQVELRQQLAAAQRAKQAERTTSVLRRAWFLTPGAPETLNALFSAMYAAGRIEEALAFHRQAAAMQPNDAAVHSYGVLMRTADPTATDADILRDAQAWQTRFAKTPLREHRVSKQPDRRLRVGYVSPTFCFHSTLYFLLPLFTHHDRSRIEVVCYSSLAKPDVGTARVKELADEWYDVTKLDDAALAQRISDGRIDILVDLSLHTTGNRLLAFAHRPAPVQVTWLAYPGTSGLRAVDYRLTDEHFDPTDEPEREANYSEKSVRLPASYWCYDPITATPEVAPLPAAASGAVTFASFNGTSKLNDHHLRVWARLLQTVPGSRLIVVAPADESRARIRSIFLECGIPFFRVELIDYRGRDLYLQFHSQVDILLDTYPFAGGLTSLEAIWMGVPVVTLAGPRVASRGGASINANLGLDHLIARTPDEYIAVAVRLAADLPALAALRASLRQRLQQSPLMDAPLFARGVEAAYRSMWHRWCETQR